jgi:hypothetical protein
MIPGGCGLQWRTRLRCWLCWCRVLGQVTSSARSAAVENVGFGPRLQVTQDVHSGAEPKKAKAVAQPLCMIQRGSHLMGPSQPELDDDAFGQRSRPEQFASRRAPPSFASRRVSIE